MINWFSKGNTAVITGGASGIGLASSERFLAEGMNVVLIDKSPDALESARETLVSASDSEADLACMACDVSSLEQLAAVCDAVFDRFGAVHCLMNNAGVALPTSAPWENMSELKTTLSVNLWGVIHGCHTFIPKMLASGESGAVINTGSKQGITRPPGNYAYNLSKAGVVAYTESIADGFLRAENCGLSAHLLIPGFVYTGMISKFLPEKPAAAWSAEQTVDFMLQSLAKGDFYILCPDNEVTRDIDEKRIQWNADDLIKNRPALSRWNPDYEEAFKTFMKE
ncbi:MAG: SDR family NAD(P)-dependent oxidoreductase [Pseudomonadota bacterium]